LVASLSLKALNTLVEQALAADPNLPAAQAALRQAQENVPRSAVRTTRRCRPASMPAVT
jgi:hypothetical protein